MFVRMAVYVWKSKKFRGKEDPRITDEERSGGSEGAYYDHGRERPCAL